MGLRITSFIPAAWHWLKSSGASTEVSAAMYALPFTGPPYLRTCRHTSYPSTSGNMIPMNIKSNSIFAQAACEQNIASV